VRGLERRLARLEDQVVEPQRPVVFRVMFADGTPVHGLFGDQSDTSASADDPDGPGPDLVYRIASWEESELDGLTRSQDHRGGRW